MKKILFIFTALILSFTLMILSSPKVYANSTSDYLFDDFTQTIGTKTLSLDASTQIWTLDGETNSATYTLPNVFAENSQGYQLYTDRNYLVTYEYISGLFTGSNFRPIDFWYTSESLNQEINIAVGNYTSTLRAFYGKELNNRSQVSIPNGIATQLKYKITIREIDSTVTGFNVFDADYSASQNNVSISMNAATSTITLNGAVNTQTSFDLKPYLSTLFENGKDYLLIYKYISGSYSRTGTGFTNRYMPLPMLQTNYTSDILTYASTRGVILSNFDTFFINPQASIASYTSTYTNLTYQVYVKDLSIVDDPVLPGETTTPPNGLFLNGATYEGQIYYNRNQELDTPLYIGYNVSTTTGNIFDLSVIESNQIDFTITGNTKFVASFIAPDTYPDLIMLSAGDISISIVGNQVHIWHGNDIETFDEFDFLASSFLEFYVLIEKENVPVTYYHLSEIVDTGIAIVGELLPNPNMFFTYPGYAFLGWVNQGGTLWNFDNDIVLSGTEINLYTHWIQTHTVTFNANGGTAVATQTVHNNALAALPPTPTRAGYVFQYWRVSSEVTTPFDFMVPITSNITLYAVWEEYIPETYTITFNSNGGTSITALLVTEGEFATAPTPPSKENSVFVGWYSNEGLTDLFSFSAPITSNMTLYAKWVSEEVTVFTITFISNGGSAVAQMYIAEGELATAPTSPTRLGYTFAGWYKNIALTNAFSFIGDVIDADITLYAKWTPVPSGGDPITPDTETASTPWLYIGLGILVLLALTAGNKKKKRG